MKISPRERRFVIAGGIATGAILAAVYVVEPFLATQSSMKEEIQTQQRILDRQALLASDRQRYERRIEEVRDRLRQEEGLLFAGEKLPLVAAEIQGLVHTLGQETGVTIVRQNVPPPRKVEMFTQVTVELSLRGDQKAIRDFLYRLQTAPKLLNVPKLAIRGTTSAALTTLTADLQVSGYVLGGEEKSSPASSAMKGASRGEAQRG